MRFIQLRKPLAEIYSEALDRSLSDEGEATRQSDMDAIRDLIEEIDTDLTTDYWRVKMRTQQELWEEGIFPQIGRRRWRRYRSTIHRRQVGTVRART